MKYCYTGHCTHISEMRCHAGNAEDDYGLPNADDDDNDDDADHFDRVREIAGQYMDDDGYDNDDIDYRKQMDDESGQELFSMSDDQKASAAYKKGEIETSDVETRALQLQQEQGLHPLQAVQEAILGLQLEHGLTSNMGCTWTILRFHGKSQNLSLLFQCGLVPESNRFWAHSNPGDPGGWFVFD